MTVQCLNPVRETPAGHSRGPPLSVCILHYFACWSTRRFARRCVDQHSAFCLASVDARVKAVDVSHSLPITKETTCEVHCDGLLTIFARGWDMYGSKPAT